MGHVDQTGRYLADPYYEPKYPHPANADDASDEKAEAPKTAKPKRK